MGILKLHILCHEMGLELHMYWLSLNPHLSTTLHIMGIVKNYLMSDSVHLEKIVMISFLVKIIVTCLVWVNKMMVKCSILVK